jgi:hypothetical protein
MYPTITGSFGIHILIINNTPTIRNLIVHKPSWILAAIPVLVSVITKIVNWNIARQKLILTKPDALKHASPDPDSSGQVIPTHEVHETNQVPTYKVPIASKIQKS